MSTWGLAWAWIRFRPLGAALNVALLGLGTATIALLMIAVQQFEQRLTADADAVDMVVGAKGSPMQLVLSTVFHVDAPVGNVPAEEVQFLDQHSMVKQVIPMALGDGFRGFRIVGTDTSYLDLYGAELAEGRLWDAPLEAVFGAVSAAQTGLGLGDRFVGEHGLSEAGGPTHDDFPYDVVGVLAPTGSVVDRLVFTSAATVQIVHEMDPYHDHDHDDHADEAHHDDHADDDDHAHHDDHADHADDGDHADEAHHDDHADDDDHAHHDDHADHADDGDHADEAHHDDHADDDDHADHADDADHAHDDDHADHADDAVLRAPEITAFLVEFSTPMAAVALPREINQSTVMQAARPAYEIQRLLRLIGFGADVVRAFAVILVVGAVLGLFTALFQAHEERRADLAVMRVLGATQRRLFWQIVVESLILTVTGIALGLVLAHGVAWGASLWLWEYSQILVSFAWADGEIVLVLTVLGLGVLAALPSAIRAAGIDIPRVLSGG
ncbi:MAG: ABC transporter permease [Rhodospirillales bacterium]|nr:ABC transporter permease [Rhodospirillales bacterium]